MIDKIFRKIFSFLVLFSTVFIFSTCKKEGIPVQKIDPPVTPPVTTVTLATADSVLILKESYSGAREAQRLAQGLPASDFSTTGFYLPPRGIVKIEVTFTKGSHKPQLLVGTYSRYSSKWNPTTYTLQAGSNTITDATGGIMYVRLIGDTPDTEIKLRFISGFKAIPYFQTGKTTQTEWKTMLEKITDVPDVQLLGKRTIITYSYNNAVKQKNEDRQILIDKADRVINIEDSISGLFGVEAPDQPNMHKYLLTESDHPDYYMAATYYRTWYRSADAVPAILSAEAFTWGPWHELGHMHQQSAWTWNEVTEVTVNIYSLAVQKAFGLNSRLQQENKWADAATYLAMPQSTKNFNAGSVSVWVRLCMFQQLKLAFGDSFYHHLHRTARREANTPTTTDEKMRWFMIKACKVSGKNLYSFFKNWGMVLSTQSATDTVYSDINSLGLPNPGVDITTLTD